MTTRHPLWDLVRGGESVEAEVRAGDHDAVLPELHEMAIRHAGPGLIGAVRDRLVRLEQAPVPPPDLRPASAHPEVKPFKPVTKTKKG